MTNRFSFKIDAMQLSKGLRPYKRIPKDSGYLVECVGAVGRDKILQVIDELTRIDTSVITDGFPYPQIFVFTNIIIVCSSTKIYEWVANALVEKLTVTAGSTWNAVDFFDYVYMSNGTVAVIRDASSHEYSITTEQPTASAICNFSGQVIVSSPGVGGVVSMDFVAYGGGVVGGEAIIETQILDFVAYGGGIAGGTSLFEQGQDFLASGGMIAGGDALFEYGSALPTDNWKNYYAVIASDVPLNAIIYAKQIGYDYIGIKPSYGNLTTNNPYKLTGQGLSFVMIDPYYDPEVYASLLQINGGKDANGKTITNPRRINVTPGTGFVYTQAQKDWYNRRMTWKNIASAWPNNLANGGWGSGTNYINFAPFWDFQQQAVIDEISSNILIAAASYTTSSKANIPFAGVYFDVPRLTGVFYGDGTGSPSGYGSVTLAYWTGTDSGVSHVGIDGTTIKQYALYSDGMATFYKKLIPDMKVLYPNAKWMIEPSRLYSNTSLDEYIKHVSQRSDKAALTPDMLSEEGPTTEFVDTSANFTSGMAITKSMVGSQMSSSGASPNGIIDEATNRTIAGKAGVNGAWFNWSLLFGNSGTAGTWTNITQVYPRLKLIKCVPNWDNLNNISLANRSWSGSVYQSLNSYISSNIIYSRHWKTKKIYVVWNVYSGVLNLNTGETVSSVQRTDGYFRESGDGSSDVNIVGTTITLKTSVSIPVDASNGQIKGVGYIITVV